MRFIEAANSAISSGIDVHLKLKAIKTLAEAYGKLEVEIIDSQLGGVAVPSSCNKLGLLEVLFNAADNATVDLGCISPRAWEESSSDQHTFSGVSTELGLFAASILYTNMQPPNEIVLATFIRSLSGDREIEYDEAVLIGRVMRLPSYTWLQEYFTPRFHKQ